ncbi:hypothetical protein MBCUT_06100 [Methanobrevibacter cuticularis]|uniref:Uncharacterized protein n=1 Tax=Methanobrevibacter cuticularis TaxID=47311 RepID=A0A166EK58_9EURY|nr:hypothetical protein [Methanobrevibacter cuticularis]KZX16746.1 hypothetical protein MBCUT_06100 [Methanobrevibacter cuticularis]
MENYAYSDEPGYGSYKCDYCGEEIVIDEESRVFSIRSPCDYFSEEMIIENGSPALPPCPTCDSNTWASLEKEEKEELL